MIATFSGLLGARRLGLCVLVVVLVAAGCGGDEGTEASGDGSVPDTESESESGLGLGPSVATAPDGVDAVGPGMLALGGLPDEATVVASGRAVRVSWPEAAPVAGSSAAGYEVQWRTGGEDWDGSRRRVVLGLSYVIGGLTDGGAYTVRVRPAEVETASVAGASITAGKGSAPTAALVEDAEPLPGAYRPVSALGSAVDFEMTGEPVWPATITMPVDLSLIDDDSEIFYGYFNEDLRAWVPAAAAVVDRQRGVATAEVYHLSIGDFFEAILEVGCKVFCSAPVAGPIGGPEQIQGINDFVSDQWDHTIGWLEDGWHLAEDMFLRDIAELAQQVLAVARETGRRLSPWVEALLDAAALVTLLPHHAKTLLDVLAGKFGYDIDPPDCTGAGPSWAQPTVMQPRKDVLLSCDETAAGGDDLGLKLTVNRTYALVMEPEERSVQIGPAASHRISVEAIDLPTDLEDLVGAGIYRLVDGDGVYLSPGATTTLRIPQSALPATRTGDTTHQLSTRLGYSVDTTATLLQTLLLGLDVATGGIAKSLKSADEARRMVVCALDVFAGGTNAIEAGSAQGMVDMIEEVVVDCLAQVLPDLLKEAGPLMVVIAAAVLLHEYGRMVADGVLNVGGQHVVVSSKNLSTPTELEGGAPDDSTPTTAARSSSGAVSVGTDHSCGLRTDGTITCWGWNDYGQADAPAGSFSAVSARHGLSCGLRTDGTITCWGSNDYGQADYGRADAPAGSFSAVSVGDGHSCGLRTDGTITCWGYNSSGWANAPAGSFSAVSVGGGHSCGLRTDGTITCWGSNFHWQAHAPAGSFSAVSAGGAHSCGLRTDGTITCWGYNSFGQADAPAGSFSAVSAGGAHSCGLRTDGTITCWGWNSSGQADAPAGSFSAVSAGQVHSCGLRTDGTITCWGYNSFGQADAPAGSFGPAGGSERVVTVAKGGLGPTSVGPGEGVPCASDTPTCRYLDVELQGFTAGAYMVECRHDGWGDLGPSTFWTFTISVDFSGSATSNGPCFLNFARLTGNGVYVTVGRPGTELITSNWLE